MRQPLAGTHSTPGRTDRLYHHDLLIVLNTLRATFTTWLDRIIAVLTLLVVLAAIRAWCADWSWPVAALSTCAAGMLIGMWIARLIKVRLAYHTFDGLLAADALAPPIGRRYAVLWHGIGLALLAALTLIVRPTLLIVSGPAYLTAALASGLTGGVRISPALPSMERRGRVLRAWAHRPAAGVAGATILLVSLLPVHVLGMNAMMAIVGVETLVLAMILTGVDDAIVRFMAIAGHGSRRIFLGHAIGMAWFLAVAVPGCWAIRGQFAAGVVAAASGAMLMLLALRILAYRLHAKRFADVVVSLLASLLALVAYAAPVALPVLALAMLWQLQRRAWSKTWLLA